MTITTKRIGDYGLQDTGVARPAIVTGVNENGTVDITVFCAPSDQWPGVLFRSDVEIDENNPPAPGKFSLPVLAKQTNTIAPAPPLTPPTPPESKPAAAGTDDGKPEAGAA